jgi:hypothetical protein
MPPEWLRFIGNTVHLSIYAFLFIAAAQNVRQRRRRSGRCLQRSARKPPLHARFWKRD